MPVFQENNFTLQSNNDPTVLALFLLDGNTGTRHRYVLPHTGVVMPSTDTQNVFALTTLAQSWLSIQTFLRQVVIDINTAEGLNPGLKIITNTDLAGNAFSVNIPTGGAVRFAINENGHILDNAFTLCDNADQTKRFHFQLEGISSAADRTITMPNSDGTMALLELSGQTWPSLQIFTGTIEVSDAVGVAPRITANSAEITLNHNNEPTPISWLDDATGHRSSLKPLATTAARLWNLPDLSIIIAGSAAALTSGRVPFASTGGILTDDADLTFATDTLTATKMVGTTSVKVGTAAGYISSDGSTGATGSFTTTDLKTVTVKDGIITSIV